MDVVSFETAKALKAGGFPQPQIVIDKSFWYGCRKELFTINETAGNKVGISPYEWFACYPYYAPSATDILRELDGAKLIFDKENGVFECFEDDHYDNVIAWIFSSKNPAEACALAWLEFNKKG